MFHNRGIETRAMSTLIIHRRQVSEDTGKDPRTTEPVGCVISVNTNSRKEYSKDSQLKTKREE